MDLTPSLVAAFIAFIGVVTWLVRMESKTNGNSRDIEDLYDKTDNHAADKEIHSDKIENNLKFAMLNSAVADVKHLVEKLDERLRRFLEK